MLLTIPYQLLEVTNILVDKFTYDHKGRIVASLSYKAPAIQFHDIPILTPPITVADYDVSMNRLRFDIRSQANFLAKLASLQDTLVSRLYQQRFEILKYDATQDDIRTLFQFLFYGATLTLFIFPNTVLKLPDGSRKMASELKKGDSIRCVIRIHGISMLPVRPGEFFPRFRIQHSVPAVWKLGA